ncbi:MAG: AAA family ATPase [Pirellulaceae bacterium]|nr:AAA family ATPase [Pirellulaceae bacterium]
MNKPAETSGRDASPDGAPLVFENRYETREVLKEGRTIRTFVGWDREIGERVVIKTIVGGNIPAGIQIRLELEADILRRIRHPLMAPLLGVGRQDGMFFLVTPHQKGIDLRAALRAGRLELQDVLTIGRCVLEVLCETHRQGVFHRDIKPANIIVDRVAPVNRAVLVDFGLAHSTQLDVVRGDQSVESVRYLAPEQAGLLDCDVGAYSDLYSLGNVMFECLAGRPVVDGRTVGDVLRQQLTVQPPKLRSLGLQLPHALDDILQRMLHKDPRDRFQSAVAVLGDIVALIEAIKRGESDPAIVVGLHDQRTTLTEPAFVGRDDELGRLDDQMHQTQQGRGGLVLLESESGGGKTRLVTEWARRGASQPHWVLRGQAVNQIAQRPFQILRGVADEIVAEARANEPLARALRTRLGGAAESVASVLPELSGVFQLDAAQTLGPEDFAERRSIDALALLLWHLGSETRPAVVILDDCQWADGLSLRLLERWQDMVSDHEEDECWVTIVAAYRSEEVGDEHLLRTLQPRLHLRLPPFGKDDLRRLVESMAGPLPGEALEVVERLSGGSPFMASAVLRGMVEAKALISEGHGWRIESMAMNDVRSSRHAAELLTRRIELLPVFAIDLLKAAAVLGKEFDLNLASQLAGQSGRMVLLSFEQAQQRHLVWSRSESNRSLFAHDKIRETLLDLLSDAERQDLQRRAAQALEQLEPQPVFDLAHLYDAAGDHQRALPFAIAAAEAARAQHSLEIAEQLYRIAVRASQGVDELTRFRIASGLGDVLMLRGHYDVAAQMFEAAKFIATEMAGGDMAKAAIEGKLGELAFKQGDMETAAACIERGLGHLGRWVPRKTESPILPLLREIAVQTLHSLLPSHFVGKLPVENAERDLATAHLYDRLSHASWFTRNRITTLWLHLRHLNVAERYEPTLELAQAYSNHAPAMSLVGWFSRGEAYATRSLKIRKEKAEIWGQAQSLHYHGIVLYASSKYRECIEKCREAVRLFQRTGDYWEMNMARYQLAASLYRLGDLPGAVAEAKLMHESGLALGDSQASGIALDIWSWAARGNVPEAKLSLELGRERNDAQAQAQVYVAEGVRLLGCNEPAKAAEILGSAWRVAQEAGVVNAWVAPVLPWLSTALRTQAKSLAHDTPLQREALLRRAQSVARRALRITRRFRNDLPHTWRELALIDAMRGRLFRARRHFERSLLEAKRQDARYEYAQSLLHRGLVGLEAGWRGAPKDVEEAQTLLAHLRAGLQQHDPTPPAATLSLADRFDSVLESGRQIASALSRHLVFAEVHDAALRLLRGESCDILLVSVPSVPDKRPGNSPGPSAEASEPSAYTFSRWIGTDHEGSAQISIASSDVATVERPVAVLLQRTIHEKRSIALGDGSPSELLDLLEAIGVRSAICTPIYQRGRPVAGLLVTHGQVSNLFQEDESRLADFIAALAGAALENAEGFGQLQRLNLTLEQRVAERTEDLQQRTTELSRSNADLEQFAYVASHDLREPLRTVSSYCELLQNRLGDRLDEETASYLQQAVQATGRMRNLINDLLTYSRVGTRGKPFQPVDCNELVDIALANLQLVIQETNAQVTRDKLPVVMGDATQLIQLFQNLIDNAIKFRGERTPQVHLTAERRNLEWLFSVHDNGIGMDREDTGRIFMLFQRLHGPREYPGTGIGLAVCRKTVERHGGQIWVESRIGAGSVFYFTLLGADGSGGKFG